MNRMPGSFWTTRRCASSAGSTEIPKNDAKASSNLSRNSSAARSAARLVGSFAVAKKHSTIQRPAAVSK